MLKLSKRLDRAVADLAWRMTFPEAYVEVLTRIHSDHNPLLVRCHTPCASPADRPFRYLAAWAEHDEYQNVVMNAWRNTNKAVCGKLSRLQTNSL